MGTSKGTQVSETQTNPSSQVMRKCGTKGNNLPPGQQPTCKNDSGLTQVPGKPATNPTGFAPPGQNR